MKNKNTFLVIFFVLFFGAFLLLKVWQLFWTSAVIEVGTEQMHVLLARNQYQWHKGLGNRDSVDEYEGMLFLFSESSRHGIVMRDMEFPIDILWIQQGTVVDIAPNVQVEPEKSEHELTKYYPRTNASSVLEVPAGWVEKHDVHIGESVRVID